MSGSAFAAGLTCCVSGLSYLARGTEAGLMVACSVGRVALRLWRKEEQ